MFRSLQRALTPNPLDRMAKKAVKNNAKHILVAWNRGLGDIALGLYGLVDRIRHFLPEAQITFLTRKDLDLGFKLLPNVKTLIDPEMKRGIKFNLDETLERLGKKTKAYDWIIESPDPTYWLKWQLGKLVPRLNWSASWDALVDRFNLDPNQKYVGVHVQTETNYNYEKNWPDVYWRALFKKMVETQGVKVILFGFEKDDHYAMDGVIDLRGQTSFFEVLSIIKNRCAYLVLPDSGVLSISYYLTCEFPVRVVSIWADPRQGVLKHGVPPPSTKYEHVALIGLKKDTKRIPVSAVYDALFTPKEQIACLQKTY